MIRRSSSTREKYGEVLVELGSQNEDIVVLGADLMHSNNTVEFARRYPDRFFNVGVAEQNMVSVAAGLATFGKVPFVSSFACFITMRSCEQVRTDVCYPRLNVKFVATHGGLSMGAGGTTHHALEDVAIMRALPNMTVIVPADSSETASAVRAAAGHDGPVYIRLGRGAQPIVFENEDDRFEIGKILKLRHGRDLSIFANGVMVFEALEAAEFLAEDGVQASVYDVHTVKPLDADVVADAIRDTGLAITAEEHSVIGGLGSAVAEVMAERGLGGKLVRIGMMDQFSTIGSHTELLQQYGLTSHGIRTRALELIRHRDN